jgi:peptidoglycan/LPS O-acetylase OafA/YrhL
MTQSKAEYRLDGLQHLRGICALLVVISHCNGILGKPEYYGAMAFADLHLPSVFAVAVFFSISGFIIVVSSLKTDLSPRHPRHEFVRRRLVRIIPFLWLCTLGYNTLSWLGTGVIEPGAILRTMALWPAGEPKPNVVWSLRNELFFYAVFAWAVLGPHRRVRLAALLLLASAVFYVLAYDLSLADAYIASPAFDALKTFMGSDFGANFQFAAGVGAALIYLRRDRTMLSRPISAGWTLAAMVIASLVIIAAPMEPGLAVCLFWTAMAGTILTLSIAARPAPGWLGRLGLVLGNASFSTYLIHNAVVLVLIALAKALRLGLETQAERMLFVVAGVVVATAAGVTVHYVIEAPLIRFVERRTRPRGSGAAPVLANDRPPQQA